MSRGKHRGNEPTRRKDRGETVDRRIKSSDGYLTYDVLRIIFRSLDGKDLSMAAMVCRTWMEAANHEKRTRGPVCCMKYNHRWCSDVTGKFIQNRFISSALRVKPALSLFITGLPCQVQNDDEPLGCYCGFLPSSCTSIKLNTAGVVLNNFEVEDQLSRLLCMFLPDIPGLKMKTFVMTYGHSVNRDIFLTAQKHTKELQEFFQTDAKSSKESNCFLLFSDRHGRDVAIKILNSLKASFPGDSLSVWGGVASQSLTACCSDNPERHIRQYVRCVGIALAGPILTWSIIVDKTHKTKEQVEQRLKLLRNRVRLERHSLGFMFACCARGKALYDERHVESRIFKSLFPDVPLFGCFGDGEFGENTVASETSRKKSHYYNEKSTVFMILSYG